MSRRRRVSSSPLASPGVEGVVTLENQTRSESPGAQSVDLDGVLERNATLQADLGDAQREIENLKRALNESSQPSGRRRTRDQRESDDDDDQGSEEEKDEPPKKQVREERVLIVEEDKNAIRSGAKQFSLMHWVFAHSNKDLFRLLSTPPNKLPDYDPSARFSTDDQQLLALQHELKDVFRNDLLAKHGAKGWFQSEVRENFTNVRSDMATRINHSLKPLIFAELLKLSRPALNRKLGHFELEDADDDDQGAWSVWDVEILHLDYADEFDEAKIFRSVWCKRVGVACMYAQSGLEEYIAGHPLPPASTTSTLASIWHVKRVTPAFIAACAIFARYALSADEKFKPRGPTTRLPYKEHYKKYVRWIHDGLHSKTDCVTSLVDEWNALLFPGSTTSSEGTDGVLADEDEAAFGALKK